MATEWRQTSSPAEIGLPGGRQGPSGQDELESEKKVNPMVTNLQPSGDRLPGWRHSLEQSVDLTSGRHGATEKTFDIRGHRVPMLEEISTNVSPCEDYVEHVDEETADISVLFQTM